MCCVLWFTVIYDDPVRHPCISAREKDHIVSSLAQQVQCPLSLGPPRGRRAARPNAHADQLFPSSPRPVDGLSP